jgi:ubiquitin-conjugating enzyme E2 M
MEIVNINELNLAETTSIFFPNGKDNLLTFEITIQPYEGYN